MHSIAILLENGKYALQSDDYTTAAICFEQVVEQQPKEIQAYLLLGLAYLLLGHEETAQLTWTMAFSNTEAAYESNLFQELVALIQEKIDDLEGQGNWELAYLLYQHLREINPQDITIVLRSIQTSVRGQKLDLEQIINCGLSDALSWQVDQTIPLQADLIEQVLEAVISWDMGSPEILSWIEEVAHYLPSLKNIVQKLYDKVVEFRQQSNSISGLEATSAYIEVGLRLDENNFALKYERILVSIKKRDLEEAALLSEQLFQESQTDQERIFAKGLLIKSLFYIPERWKEAEEELKKVLLILDKFISEHGEECGLSISSYFLLNSIFYYQYTQDNPYECRSWQNRLSSFYSKSLEKRSSSTATDFQVNTQIFRHTRHPKTYRKLRVGFLSKFMTRHSIGWLSRWIFQHYNPTRFEFYVYFQNHDFVFQGIPEFSETWFSRCATKASIVYGEHQEIAQKIYTDEVDILVDLDSITSEKNYAVMALKPAPIQVTWLGYDASGLPAIDYFLVDSFVVPDNADEYYAESLWRLPQTYVAVDGFEVGTPTLDRESLNIPVDAVIYFSAQAAAKRHPDTVSWQLQILKQVPNSYLLLKSIVGDTGSLRTAFFREAEAHDVDPNRFRFLELDIDEPTHRANLGIADVVLDTYPYTGATTTLETLWMGIPLVTRVGKQFASRNSYAMLRQVGVEAGIAHSAEEYIEWGVRFGTDAALREQVKEQLRRSRQTSPLWNAEQFTRDMENAFEQMWQKFSTPLPP